MQPKRLALLVYLAMAAEPVRRDRLVALFWPELNEERSHAALSEALRYLRQALSHDCLISRGKDEIGAAAAVIWCDAVDFVRACQTADSAEALAHYRGRFLDGFFVGEVAPEFEEWVAAERRRLDELASRTAWLESAPKERQGDLEAALWLARMAITCAPDDELGRRRLIALLDRSGDRAGALAAFEEWQRYLALEHEADPAPETISLIETVRTRRHVIASSPPAADRPEDLAAPDRAPGPVTAATESAGPPNARLRRLPTSVGPIAMVATLITIWLAASMRSPSVDEGERSRTATPEPSALPESTTTLPNARPGNPAVEGLLLKAHWYQQRRTIAGLQQARDLALRVLEIDPGEARGYAALATAYTGLSYYRELAPSDGFVRAEAAARRALTLDPSSAEAMGVIGSALASYHWDWSAAERTFRRALAVDSTAETVHNLFGIMLRNQHRFAEALVHFKAAARADPLSRHYHRQIGVALRCSGREEEALGEFRQALAVDPGYALGHEELATTYAQMGQYDQALAELRTAVRLAADSSGMAWLRGLRGQAGYDSVQRLAARQALDQYQHRPVGAYYSEADLAENYRSLGLLDSMFIRLERAAADRDVGLLTFDCGDRKPEVSHDPRWRAIKERIGIPFESRPFGVP